MVRRIGDEVLPEHIGCDGLVMTAHRRAFEAFPYLSNEAFCLLQPNDPLPTHSIPLLVQVVMNPRTPIGTATRLMGGTDQYAQLAVPARMGRRRPTYPGIKATPRDIENLTQVSDRHGGLLRLDERESYSLSFAKKAAGLLHHSDQGSPYASEDYQRLLETHDMTGSMSRRGNCYDNAVIESWFSTVKHELGGHFLSCGEAKMALFDFIEVFYNQRRRHSTLGQVSPAEFERRMMTSAA